MFLPPWLELRSRAGKSTCPTEVFRNLPSFLCQSRSSPPCGILIRKNLMTRRIAPLYPLSLVNEDEAIALYVLEHLLGAAGPADFDALRLRRPAGQVKLR